MEAINRLLSVVYLNHPKCFQQSSNPVKSVFGPGEMVRFDWSPVAIKFQERVRERERKEVENVTKCYVELKLPSTFLPESPWIDFH